MPFLLGECLLRDRLDVRGITPSEFARKMGVSRQYINKLMSGEKVMSLEFAINAAYLLECRPSDFYVLTWSRNRQDR